MADPTIHSAVGLSEGAASATTIVSPTLATTTGRFLVVLAGKYHTGTTITGVTDTAGNTYTRAGSSQGTDASHTQEIWFTASPITGNAANAVTVTYSAAATYRVVSQAEVSLSGATAMAYDAEATIALTASGTTHASNSLTTSATDALILGGWVAWGSDRELSDGTGTIMWEEGGAAVDGAAFAYRFTDAPGSYSISLTSGAADQFTVNAKSFSFTGGGGGGGGSTAIGGWWM